MRVRTTIVAASVTYSECVSVALVMKHAMRMRRDVLSPMARLALPHFFSHDLINDKIFGKKLY
jgi:hypothetical protein